MNYLSARGRWEGKDESAAEARGGYGAGIASLYNFCRWTRLYDSRRVPAAVNIANVNRSRVPVSSGRIATLMAGLNGENRENDTRASTPASVRDGKTPAERARMNDA
jgi:hypothetical protein